jgi:hypothetical protein
MSHLMPNADGRIVPGPPPPPLIPPALPTPSFFVAATAGVSGGNDWGQPHFVGMGGGSVGPAARAAGVIPHASMTRVPLPPTLLGSPWLRSPVLLLLPNPSAIASVAAVTGNAMGGTQGEVDMAGHEHAEGVEDMAGADNAGKIIAPQRENF